MRNQKLSNLSLAALILCIWMVTACTGGPPNVYSPQKYNRDSSEFLEGTKDRTEVTVCYSKSGGTPAQVTQLARQECARFGKRAVFREQSYQLCPMITPVAAIFDCISP